ncbi:hypothetical protein [Serratia odorifera]|uniref:hypothetical protein n=1 Tax=Serratia odorifera TaxID=618 RepID=UPI00235E0F6B|nr:hypothetical protein [Serratia odorifera]
MKKIEAFIKLAKILNTSEVSSEDNFIVTKLNKLCNTHEKDDIKTLLEECGYVKSSDAFEGDDQIWLDKRSTYWDSGECGFYSNIDALWQRCYQSDSLPEFFYVIDKKISALDCNDDETLITLNLYFNWKKLLLDLSDHYANQYYVFFMVNDKGGDKIEIESTLDIKELPKLTNPKKHLELVMDLQRKLDFKDLHTLERRAVMRATLGEIAKEQKKEVNLLGALLASTALFDKKYNELYEIYTKRFSVNKLLNELDEKSLEFTAKINEFISSSQTKALTIPGALIAVGALAKVEAPLEALIIIGALWMIKKVNISSNQVYRDAFDALDNRLENAFKKYLKFHNELEVKQSAESIRTELSELITNSKTRLSTLDRLANAMYYGGTFYLFLKLATKDPYKTLLHKAWSLLNR